MLRKVLLSFFLVTCCFAVDYTDWSEFSQVADNFLSSSTAIIKAEVLSGGTVVVVWVDFDGNISSTYSLDGGRTWPDTSTPITTGGNCSDPQLVLDPTSGDLVCVFVKDNSPNYEIDYMKTVDGQSWSAAVPISGVISNSLAHPRLAASSFDVMCVWSQENGANTDIYYNIYAAGAWSGASSFGGIFGPETYHLIKPQIVCGGDDVYKVLFQRNYDSPPSEPEYKQKDLFLATYNASGFNWNMDPMFGVFAPTMPPEETVEDIDFFVLAIDNVFAGQFTSFAFCQAKRSDYPNYVLFPIKSNQITSPEINLDTPLAEEKVDLRMDPSGTYALFAYPDSGTGYLKMITSRDAGTSWNPVGSPDPFSSFSSSIAYPSIAIYPQDNNEAVCIWSDSNMKSSFSVNVDGGSSNWSDSPIVFSSSGSDSKPLVLINSKNIDHDLDIAISFISDGVNLYSSYTPSPSHGVFSAYGNQYKQKLLLQGNIFNAIYWNSMTDAVKYRIYSDSILSNLIWEGVNLEYSEYGVLLNGTYTYYVTWVNSEGENNPAVAITLP